MQLAAPAEDTIEGAGALLRSGALSCGQLAERCLARIAAREAALRAWVHVDREGALAQAQALDLEFQQGADRGPLHGIPLGIKDLVDMAGLPTAAGSARRSSERATSDAPLVTRLRDAGAVLLGKTVTTQFACFDPAETTNPWNAGRTPGGSSSGSAAAVAAGMCLGALGSQTGGSITRPASFCGVAGCKPTFGRLPVTGVVPVAPSLDHPGPIARTVGDLAILMEVLAPELSGLHARRSSPPRLGRLRGLFETRAAPEMQQALDATLARLITAGATVRDVPLPGLFDDLLACHRTIMLFELGEVHQSRFEAFPEDYLPGIAGLIRESRQLSRGQYDQARAHQGRLKREVAALFAECDALVCPATIGPAPDRATTGDPSFNSPWSYTGLPTVSFPMGLAPDGLPLAIQLVAAEGAERSLFGTSLWCEAVVRQ